MSVNVSIVIPTRNRASSLNRLLQSIELQSVVPSEIIIVDSSDDDIDSQVSSTTAPQKLIKSQPSVCIQRNIGIEASKGKYILLCDDDIELPSSYIKETTEFLENNPSEGVITGTWSQIHEGKWTTEYPIKSFGKLFYYWLFGLGIWSSLDSVKSPFIFRPICRSLETFYRRKGNYITKAGWPVNTQYNSPVYKVAVNTLGSSLIRASWLDNVRYDEVLDPHGYGDNYGVCIDFKVKQPINIFTELIVKHHHSKANRATTIVATYRRLLALHLFISTNERFNRLNRMYFVWSAFGRLLEAIMIRDFTLSKSYFRAFWKIVFRTNPYLKGGRAIVPN